MSKSVHPPVPALPPAAPPSGAASTEPPPEVRRASLRASIKDGSAWSFMQGAGVGYVAPFVILGGSGLLRIALLSGLPQLAGAIVQWFAANITDDLGRRNRIIVGAAFTQALTWLPMCLAIFLPSGPAYWVMLCSYVAFVGLTNIPNPAWQSLMGDLVPADRRGRYFGMRNALCGSVQVAATFGAGWWLKFAGARPDLALFGLDGQAFGFLVLFALSCAARFVSAYYLAQVYEPPYRPQARRPLYPWWSSYGGRRAPTSAGSFSTACWVNIGIGLVGNGLNIPFLAWFLLERQHVSMRAFGAILTANVLATLVAHPFWGRLQGSARKQARPEHRRHRDHLQPTAVPVLQRALALPPGPGL